MRNRSSSVENVVARMGLGCLAAVAATYVMDEVTEIFYSEDIARRERDVQPESSTHALARRLQQRLGLNPTGKDIDKVASRLHWSFGIGNGAIAGLLANGGGVRASLAVAAGMFVFDEVGLWLLGAAPPSSEYPWQTNLRSALGHLAYAASLALAYETLASLIKPGSA